MALSVKAGHFTANTSTGNQSVTGVGFQGKALILFCGYLTSATESGKSIFGFGAATSSSERWAINGAASDATTTTDTEQSASATRCLFGRDTTGFALLELDFVSFDSDGFTVNVAATDATAYLVQYLVLGGSDLSNVKAGTFNLGAATGSQSFTGIGFQADCFMFGNIGGTTWPFDSDFEVFSIGAATSVNQGACAYSDWHALGDSDTSAYQRDDEMALEVNQFDTEQMRASLTTIDVDGLTVNRENAPFATQTVGYLAMKGARFKVGKDTQKTSTGTKATTGVGFQPSALVIWGDMQTTSASPHASAHMTMGATDGTNNEAAIVASTDNLADAETARSVKTDKCVVCLAPATPSITSAANLSSFDSDGFTLDWTAADATAREFLYLAVGALTVATFPSDNPPIGIAGRGAGW